MRFEGAFTAIVTPFKNGAFDEEAYRRHVEWQIEQGINGIVPCGTTGEAATLTHKEHEDVIRVCIEQVKGRVPVLAGAGSNNTKEAIHYTEYAKKMGADATMHISPYYNKPSQEGLYQHFKAITEAVDLPLCLYNVPSRTACHMLPETVARIAKDMPLVKGIKDATGDLAYGSNLIEQCPDDFCILSGDDFTLLPLMALGGTGIVSVSSNVAPAKTAKLCRLMLEGKLAEARAVHFELEPINRAMFIDSNPGPVKTALHYMGFCDLEFRLPLAPLDAEKDAKLKEMLASLGLI